MWQAHARYCCLCWFRSTTSNITASVNPPTGSQMGLAYMRKSQFRSVQLTSRLRTDGVKSRFSLNTRPGFTRQGEYCTVHLEKKKIFQIMKPGKSLLVLPVMILLLFMCLLQKVQLKEHKHIEIQRVLSPPPKKKEMKDLFLTDLLYFLDF